MRVQLSPKMTGWNPVGGMATTDAPCGEHQMVEATLKGLDLLHHCKHPVPPVSHIMVTFFFARMSNYDLSRSLRYEMPYHSQQDVVNFWFCCATLSEHPF